MNSVLDLFAGACGGWSLGMHRAGYETIAACEIDPWRREQYQRNNPSVRIYDDVRALGADRLHADGLFPDIVVGSPPCQDISSANHNGKGVDGDRSGLFFEALRIIREIRPVWGCLENSPNLRNRGSDRVLGYLEAIGYAVWPLVVGAKDLGANHIRRRVWVVFADAEKIGRGTRRSWGSDPGRAGQQNELGAWRTEDAADPQRNPLRIKPRGCRGTNGAGSAIAVVDGADPDRQGQYDRAEDGRAMARSTSDAGDASDARGTEPVGRDSHRGRLGRQSPERRERFTPNDERLIGSSGNHWSSSAPDFGQLDDGLSSKLARACISAYGDAVVPQIPEIIGRAMRRIIHA